jgi:hypothetical protein
MSYRAIALAILASIPGWADASFRIHILPRTDLPPGKGQCDIRLQVDEEVQITIRRDQISVHNTSGQDARDDGSDCNIPVPDGDIRNFALQSVEARSEVRVLEKPSEHNGFAVVVRIRDTAEGFGRYHFRLTWEAAPPNPERPSSNLRNDEDRPPVPPSFVWNNAMTYRGRGGGESAVDDQAQELSSVRVDIDLGGKIVVSFQSPQPAGVRGKSRPVLFSGTVIAREGSNIRADVVTENRRLHGTMTLAMDGRQNVTSIKLNATDGQTHLHLTWSGH